MLTKRNSLGNAKHPTRSVVAIIGCLFTVILMGVSNPLLGQEEDTNFDLVGRLIDGQTGRPLLGASVGLAGSDWS